MQKVAGFNSSSALSDLHEASPQSLNGPLKHRAPVHPTSNQLVAVRNWLIVQTFERRIGPGARSMPLESHLPSTRSWSAR
jgi:hypothetical protein